MILRRLVAIFIVLIGLALVACGGKKEPMPRPAIPENAALRIVGAVAQEYGWTLEELKAMDTIEVEAPDRAGKMHQYKGVPINALLDVAQPKPEATAIQLRADFGYIVDVPLADVRACEKCLVVYDEGTKKLLSVMPGFDTTAQVDGLVRLLVK
ncbi:MAG: hypothetical protein FJZ90_17935 [Chloroflexi bacterium]|nr:hypothetical protein [Chloroflexota bacterium]